ncbi:MAG: hypothetical protein RIC95_02060 [Vicingaceae bacterium]
MMSTLRPTPDPSKEGNSVVQPSEEGNLNDNPSEEEKEPTPNPSEEGNLKDTEPSPFTGGNQHPKSPLTGGDLGVGEDTFAEKKRTK